MFKKKASGEITVFISLILVLILGVIFTLLESARSEGLKLRIQMAADAGIESVFAQYDKCLWEDYGLLFFNDRYGAANELSAEALKYADKNSGSASALFGGDWLSFKSKQVDVNSYILATDNDGAVFKSAVCNYMKSAGIVSEILTRIKESDLDGVFDEDFFNSDGEIDFSKVRNLISEASEKETNAISSEENKDKENNATDKESAKKTYNGLLEKMETFAGKGFLSLVVSDVNSISDERYNLADAPSMLSNSEKSRTDGEIEKDVFDDALFSEYLMSNFNSYTDKDYESLQIEYLICGKDSDLANLFSTVNRLVGVRMGLNLIFMFSSSKCNAEATAIATALVGWLLMPDLVNAVQKIILILWSLCESVADVKALLSGGKIPLIKNDSELQLSLATAAKSSVEKPGCESGLNYKEYLRALLLLSNGKDVSYRAMDIIQIHIRKEEPAFTMQNCIYAASISLSVSAESLFPFLPARVDYEHSFASAYSYGNVSKFY